MSDLNSGIDFDEVEVVFFCIKQEFHGSSILVAHGASDLDRGFTDGVAGLGVEERSRGNFHNFLVPSLDRTISFEQMDQISMFIPQQLNFDVSGLLNEFFDENIGRTKCGH